MAISPGRILLSLAGLVASVGPYVADYNATHVFNPNWPPHAKFHNGQTMSMGLLLGVCTQFYTFRNGTDGDVGTSASRAATLLARRERDLATAALLASLYWITQLSAWFYPGSLPMDPEFGDGFPQLWISLGVLSLVVAGFWLESRSIARWAAGLAALKSS